MDKKYDLEERLVRFAGECIKFCNTLGNTFAENHLKGQLIRSSTSVAANYRAACKARTYKEFVAKLGTVVEEADETLFWLEIIIEKMWVDKSELEIIWKEGNELTAIFVSSLKTVNNRINK